MPRESFPELIQRLDRLGDSLIIYLRERSVLPKNPDIYVSGRFPACDRDSLLMHHLRQIESYHAMLGRFDYDNQFAFTDTASITDRIITGRNPERQIEKFNSDIGNKIIRYYFILRDDLCKNGNDPHTFGEAVTADGKVL